MAFARRRFSRFKSRRSRLRQPRLVRSAPLRAVHFYSKSATLIPFTNPGGANANSAVLLNDIVRGSSITNRSGNRVRNMSLIITGQVSFNPFRTGYQQFTNTGTLDQPWEYNQNVSLCLFWSPTTNSAIPTLDQYFDISTFSLVDTWSLPRITELPSLRLLWRKDYQMVCIPNGTNGTAPTQAHYSAPARMIPVRARVRIPFMSSYGNVISQPAIGDITSGCLLLYALGDYNSGSGPAEYQRPETRIEARLAFTDVD